MIEILGEHLRPGICPLKLEGHKLNEEEVRSILDSTQAEHQAKYEYLKVRDAEGMTVSTPLDETLKFSSLYSTCCALAALGVHPETGNVSVLTHGISFREFDGPDIIDRYRKIIRNFIETCGIETTDFIIGGGIRDWFREEKKDDFLYPLLTIAEVIAKETQGEIRAIVVPPARIDIPDLVGGCSFKAWLIDTQKRTVHIFEELYGKFKYEPPETRAFCWNS